MRETGDISYCLKTKTEARVPTRKQVGARASVSSTCPLQRYAVISFLPEQLVSIIPTIYTHNMTTFPNLPTPPLPPLSTHTHF